MSREKCPTCEQLVGLFHNFSAQIVQAVEALVDEDHGVENQLIELLSSESPDFEMAAKLILALEAVKNRKLKAEIMSGFIGMVTGTARVDKPKEPTGFARIKKPTGPEHGHSLEDLIRGLGGPLEP